MNVNSNRFFLHLLHTLSPTPLTPRRSSPSQILDLQHYLIFRFVTFLYATFLPFILSPQFTFTNCSSKTSVNSMTIRFSTFHLYPLLYRINYTFFSNKFYYRLLIFWSHNLRSRCTCIFNSVYYGGKQCLCFSLSLRRYKSLKLPHQVFRHRLMQFLPIVHISDYRT